MNRTISFLRKACNGVLRATYDADAVIHDLCIDSRSIDRPAGALFIALKSARRNGHAFLEEAYQKGVRSFLVQEPVPAALLQDCNVIEVQDTLLALQQVAAAHRREFQGPVIGITGSNGKTIVKEWLFQVLSEDGPLVRSPKSFNSQIGVPLSVWLMDDEHRLAILEAGISQPGEMERLERIIHPTIGLFTNIGEAHSEGFLNQRQKINEKLVLFRHAQQLVYCRDHLELHECIVQFAHQLRGSHDAGGQQLFTWSFKHDADLRVVQLGVQNGHTRLSGTFRGEVCEVEVPFADPASVENAIHCWALMLVLGHQPATIQKRLLSLQPVAMRLELRRGIHDCTVINDTYNSDLTSLRIALDYLERQVQHDVRTVILSDMFQVGKPDAELYEEVGQLIAQRNISRFIGVGPAIYRHREAFEKHRNLRTAFFKTTDDLVLHFHLIQFEKEAILLKGARAFAFERISMLLEEEVHQTVLSIDLSALVHNLNVYRQRLAPGTRTMAMVKAFSYGSGSHEIATVLQHAGVEWLTVAYTDEGVALRKAGIKMPIMVMSPDAGSFDRMIAWKLEPEIFNFRSLQAFTSVAEALGATAYPVHIKLDTGMHRLGFMEHELDTLGQLLQGNARVRVGSMFSHLAASEDAAMDGFTLEQAEAFTRMSSKLVAMLGYQPLRHLCNSAGIARHPELHFDMVRLGLGLYGIDSTALMGSGLRQISTLKTTIAQIKQIPKGDTVGYNRRALAERDMKLATVCIGYADGYPRVLGNGNAYMLVRGQQARLFGTVCMDLCMLDVTDIPEVQEGDEVLVFGPELPLTLLASWSGTIPYEIMTGISQRVKRIYINEG